MWNATITDVVRVGTSIKYYYTLTNGTETITLDHIGDKESLERQIMERIANLVKVEAGLAEKESVIGPITPSVKEPVEAERAKQTFLANLFLLRQYRRAEAEGLIERDTKAVTDLDAVVKSTFLPEYINII